MQKVALLGVGAMGSGMAANWLNKGFPLVLYNRTPGKLEALAAKGAKIAATPAEAAEDADVIVAMVADDDASREVWSGGDGALNSARPGAIAIESSTVMPGWIATLAGYAKAHECLFLDAPVTGSRPAAAAGQLTMLVGGDEATLDKARPALAAISRAIVHVGPVGAGATWKLINNMMLAVQIVGLSEGLALAKKAGFDVKGTAERILASATASPVVHMKMPRMVAENFADTDFALKHMAKDLRYALRLAEEKGVQLEAVAIAADVFARAEGEGLGDLDFSTVLKTVQKDRDVTS